MYSLPFNEDEGSELIPLIEEPFIKDADSDDAGGSSPRSENPKALSLFCILSLFALVIVVVLLLDVVLSTKTAVIQRENLYIKYDQYRRDQFGSMGNPHFVSMNTYENKVERRIRDMQELNSVRFGHCKDFELHWKQVLDNKETTTNWRLHTTNASRGFRSQNSTSSLTILPLIRSICEAPHPTRKGVKVTMERTGGFTNTGGYDQMGVKRMYNIGNLREDMKGKDVYFVGGLLAPVFLNGSIAGYPPVHIHHAHLYPYGDVEERHRKIPYSKFDAHDVLFQSHGDSACRKEQGDTACLLHVLEPGYGYRVRDSQSGMGGDFLFNIVQQKREDLLFFMEYTLLTTETIPRQTVSYLGVNSPCIGNGPCTYHFPKDPHSNMMFFTYRHEYFGGGRMRNFEVHSHQTLFDSFFVFKGSNRELLRKLELLKQPNPMLPYILDCNNLELGEVKRKVVFELAGNDTLVCEATKPGLNFQDGKPYDKRTDLYCRTEIAVNVGDVLTIVAFNRVRKSQPTQYKQHSILRAEFLIDSTDDDYRPPSYFYYPWEKTERESYYNITDNCPSTISW